MKRFAMGLAFLLSFAAASFAQTNGLQVLAVIKLNKSETITVNQLKNRVEVYQKQNGGVQFTPEQKKEILDALIDEKLVVQQAQKEGFNLTDSQVNAYFLQSLSQQAGKQVTEAEFAEIVKNATGKSLDDFMKDQVGMTVADYKAYLKNQLIAQQYVLQKKQNELQTVAPTDAEIRSFYEMNKSSFVWSDMAKLFLTIVPKGKDAQAAHNKVIDLKNQYTKNPAKAGAEIKNSKENGTTFQAGEILIQKTAQHAQQLGVSYQSLLELFNQKIGYTSEIQETDNDYQFYSILQKYDAKLLGISDIVQPESTTTVYEYIKASLTQQKQAQYLSKAIQEITKELDTSANVDRKKTGDELLKILAW